jgi:hypothetical protein
VRTVTTKLDIAIANEEVADIRLAIWIRASRLQDRRRKRWLLNVAVPIPSNRIDCH